VVWGKRGGAGDGLKACLCGSLLASAPLLNSPSLPLCQAQSHAQLPSLPAGSDPPYLLAALLWGHLRRAWMGSGEQRVERDAGANPR
jgi:hypothetical protein